MKQGISMLFTNKKTQTTPVVFHATGKDTYRDFWKGMCDKVLATELKKEVDRYKYMVVSWSTYDEETICEKCLKKLDATHTILGKGHKNWINIDKMRLLNEIIDTLDVDYIIGLDSFDVIITGHPNNIIDGFLKFDCEMLFNAASGGGWPLRYPPLYRCYEYERSSTHRNRFLNAGVWVGKIEYVKYFVQKVIHVYNSIMKTDTKYKKYEQPFVKLAAIPDELPKIKLDSGCKIFQHMWNGKAEIQP